MKLSTKLIILLACLAGLVMVPYFGAYVYFDGDFPTDYFEYPPLTTGDKADFHPVVFWAIAAFGLLVILLYIRPQLFGFKTVKAAPKPKVAKVKWPVWAWTGLVIWAAALIAIWSKAPNPRWLVDWAYLPLFWGFTLMVDGWVFVRTGGKSLCATAPREMIGMAVAAMSGWMMFEYLNFFVDDNWFYPKGGLIQNNQFLIYAILGSSGLMPPIYELYDLLCTFPRLKVKYTQGPKINLPKWFRLAVLLGSFVALFLVGFYPHALFGMLWVAPLLIFAVALGLIGEWTPFVGVKNGNWGPLLLYGITYVIYGFMLEFWNYFSATHVDGVVDKCFNPAHWVYAIPMVNKYHVFEMPVLGYLGYIPFGVYCAVWWLMFAYLLGIKTKYVKGGFDELEA